MSRRRSSSASEGAPVGPAAALRVSRSGARHSAATAAIFSIGARTSSPTAGGIPAEPRAARSSHRDPQKGTDQHSSSHPTGDGRFQSTGPPMGQIGSRNSSGDSAWAGGRAARASLAGVLERHEQRAGREVVAAPHETPVAEEQLEQVDAAAREPHASGRGGRGVGRTHRRAVLPLEARDRAREHHAHEQHRGQQTAERPLELRASSKAGSPGPGWRCIAPSSGASTSVTFVKAARSRRASRCRTGR